MSGLRCHCHSGLVQQETPVFGHWPSWSRWTFAASGLSLAFIGLKGSSEPWPLGGPPELRRALSPLAQGARDVLEGRDGLGAVRSEAPLHAADLDAAAVHPLADVPDLLRVPAEVPVPQLPERRVVDDVGTAGDSSAAAQPGICERCPLCPGSSSRPQ